MSGHANYFLLLSAEDQRSAILRLAGAGYSMQALTSATSLSEAAIRKILDTAPLEDKS